MISLFYESILRMCGSVAVHIDYGIICHGKTNAAKVALAAACNLEKGSQTYLSDSIARHHLGGGGGGGGWWGRGWAVFDDPSNNSVLKVLFTSFCV